jgi:DNA-binding MarR family transcriptional regulator
MTKYDFYVDMGLLPSYIVNTMNNKSALKTAGFLAYQTSRLRELIQEIIQCCDDRKLFESKKFFLPYAELKCLMLFNEKQYLTVKNIAQSLDVAKSRVTKLIHGLTEKGLVESIDDPKDARIKIIRLTKAGKKRGEDIEAFQMDIHHKILAQLSSADRKHVLSCLELLRSAMEAVKGQLV